VAGRLSYAPAPSGNVATEDMIAMLDGMGIATGVDLAALLDVADFVEQVVGRRLDGKVKRAAAASRERGGP
jgi:isopropylmalate/homocitrate/citramalate synthase